MLDRPLEDKDFLLSEGLWQRLSSSIYSMKPLQKLKDLARAILEINADVLFLCEIGGRESLENFNKYFLNSEYSCYLIEGNSERNIDVGYLVRKKLAWNGDLLTNKNRLIHYIYPHEKQSAETNYIAPTTGHKLSRDAAELRLFIQDREKPFLILLMTHLKSRLDPDGIDPGGFERRQAELGTLLKIHQELRDQFPTVPQIVAGDFNGNASRNKTDSEFQQLYQLTELEDVLEIMAVPAEKRSTFFQVKAPHRVDARQLDYCFLTPELKSKLTSASVYRYKDGNGWDLEYPEKIEEKQKFPSDHSPLVFEIENLQVMSKEN